MAVRKFMIVETPLRQAAMEIAGPIRAVDISQGQDPDWAAKAASAVL
jgi:hypothetical protein